MAREHEAARSSLLEVLRFARRERDSIADKMGQLKSNRLLARDRRAMAAAVDDRQREFDAAWEDRKAALTKHARFASLVLQNQKEIFHEYLLKGSACLPAASGPSRTTSISWRRR